MSHSPLDSQYNAQVNDVMTKMARFIPFVMVLYGLAVHFQLVAGSPLYSWPAFAAIVTILIITGLTQPPDFDQAPVRQFIYYALFLSFAMFVTGMQSVLLFWIPLSVTTILNFNKSSFWWTTLLLFVFCVLDGLVRWPLQGSSVLFSNLILGVVTTIAAGVVVAIVLAQMRDHDGLIKARRQESLQFGRMQALVNSLDDAIISVNNKGVIKLYNSTVLNLFDTNRDLNGTDLDSLVNLYDRNDKKHSLFEIVSGSNRPLHMEEFSHQFSDGEKVRLSITSTAIHASYGAVRKIGKGYILILRDITKTKSLEEERDEFIAVISHELRTPIAITEASLSNMQFFAQKHGGAQDIIKGLGEAHDQVVFLAKMINDLSGLARAERSSETEKEDVPIDVLLENLYKEYTGQAQEAGLLLNLDLAGPLGIIQTNRLYLEEILHNFLSNALKYTRQGTITLHAHRTDKEVILAVQDTGLGISKSDQNKVFGKFYRSEDYRTRETGGTGLGLYVAQKLAQKLGTRILLDSRLHHGSTFSVSLPIAASSEETPA